jgi:two-component system sensor kinase
VLANAVGEQMFGYGPASLTGRPLSDLIPERFREAHGGHVAAFRRDGVTHRRMATFFPLYGLRADGSEFPIEASISKFAVNEEPLLTAIVRDVSLQRRLKGDLLEAGDLERRRIGNDLHDELGPVLTGLRYLCDAARRRVEGGGSVSVDDLSRISNGLASALTSMRLVARTLAPAEIAPGHFGTALMQLARQTQEFFGIPCTASIDDRLAIKVPPEVATSLSRIALEATNNAAKHSCATQIEIILRGDSRSVELTVADDGRGMPDLPNATTQGIGLRSMDYRAKLLGAAFTVTGRTPRGTAVTCAWPVRA